MSVEGMALLLELFDELAELLGEAVHGSLETGEQVERHDDGEADSGVLSIFFRKIMNRILVAVSQGWSRHRTHIDASYPYISLCPIGNSRHDVIWRRRASRHSLHRERCQ